MYAPTLGRFLQRDPLGYVDGMNMYAYVTNNPTNYLDPMGLQGTGNNTLYTQAGTAHSSSLSSHENANFKSLFNPFPSQVTLGQQNTNNYELPDLGNSNPAFGIKNPFTLPTEEERHINDLYKSRNTNQALNQARDNDANQFGISNKSTLPILNTFDSSSLTTYTQDKPTFWGNVNDNITGIRGSVGNAISVAMPHIKKAYTISQVIPINLINAAYGAPAYNPFAEGATDDYMQGYNDSRTKTSDTLVVGGVSGLSIALTAGIGNSAFAMGGTAAIYDEARTSVININSDGPDVTSLQADVFYKAAEFVGAENPKETADNMRFTFGVAVGAAGATKFLNGNLKIPTSNTTSATRQNLNIADNIPQSRVSVFNKKPIDWTATRAKGTHYNYKITQRTDIDWNHVRTSGPKKFRDKTNAQAGAAGYAPQLPDGNFATLHHLGQKAPGPLVEASTRYHGVGKNPGQKILHGQYGVNKSHPTLKVNHNKFSVDTREYWKWRVKNLENS